MTSSAKTTLPPSGTGTTVAVSTSGCPASDWFAPGVGALDVAIVRGGDALAETLFPSVTVSAMEKVRARVGAPAITELAPEPFPARPGGRSPVFPTWGDLPPTAVSARELNTPPSCGQGCG